MLVMFGGEGWCLVENIGVWQKHTGGFFGLLVLVFSVNTGVLVNVGDDGDCSVYNIGVFRLLVQNVEC